MIKDHIDVNVQIKKNENKYLKNNFAHSSLLFTLTLTVCCSTLSILPNSVRSYWII